MTVPLVSTWAPRPDGSEHLLTLYERDVPHEEVAEFLRAGQEAGEAVVVIARPETRSALRERIGEAAHLPCFSLDAERTLARFMVDGLPDPDRFDESVGALLNEAARQGNGRVRAYGEMVAVLAEAGQTAAALQLEGLWNLAASRRSISLLCAYRSGSLDDADVHAVRGTHSGPLPHSSA